MRDDWNTCQSDVTSLRTSATSGRRLECPEPFIATRAFIGGPKSAKAAALVENDARERGYRFGARRAKLEARSAARLFAFDIDCLVHFGQPLEPAQIDIPEQLLETLQAVRIWMDAR